MEQTRYDVERSVRIVRYSRRFNKIDKIVLRIFRKVFLRWCDSHLSNAHEYGLLGSEAMHILDAQMKGDLGFKGYLKEL